MSQPIRCQGSHLVFLKNLVEDAEILLPIKFPWIPFNGFRGEVENASANLMPGRSCCFSHRPEKHKLGRGRWDLASCQVFWFRFSGFRGNVENVSANQRPGRSSCFSDRPAKSQPWYRRLRSCFLSSFLEFRSAVQRRSRKCLSQSEARVAILLFPDRPEKHKLGRGRWDIASYQVSLNSVQRLQRRSRKCLSQSYARAPILFFLLARKTQTW